MVMCVGSTTSSLSKPIQILSHANIMNKYWGRVLKLQVIVYDIIKEVYYE